MVSFKWKLKRGKWRRVSVESTEQLSKTLMLSATIRAIYDMDANLTPAEQMQAIKALPGMTFADMQSVIMTTGPALADSIKSIISKDRASDDTRRSSSSSSNSK